MHRYLLALLLVAASARGARAQEFRAADLSRIVWRASIEPAAGLRAGQEATLRLEADLPGEWHVYSVDAGDEYVFKPASLRLLPAAQGIELVGPLTASAPTHTEHDEVLEGKVVYFTHRAAFTQRIKVTKNNPVLRCVLGYQACEYKEFNTCIFPEIEMEIRPRAAR